MKGRGIFRGVCFTAITFACALIFVTCGGKQSSVAPLGRGLRAPPPTHLWGAPSFQAATPCETTLTEALAELDALPTPEGVDESVFSALKAALREALQNTWTTGVPPVGTGETPVLQTEEKKLVSSPPTGEANRVDDLALTDNGDGTYTLTWSYKNVGDYNQDGIVNIMDITPLAVHFNETADETNEWIDGNEDTVIDIKDITPLAANFLTEVAGYVIEGAPSEFSEFSEVDRAPFVYEEGLSARKGVEYILREEDARDNFWFRVVAYDGEGNLSDVFSNAARRPFIPGNPPEIGSISELAGDSGSAQVFTAQVSGDTPISYRIDFAGGAEPSVITGVIESYEGDHAELTANITLSRGGDLLEPTKNYPAKLTLTNASGEASSDILLSVTAIWHIEEIPKVPGYEDKEFTFLPDYDLAPDGSLWGVHTYAGIEHTFLIHSSEGRFEYEHLEYHGAYDLKVDRNGNPALTAFTQVDFLQYERYFARKVDGVWEEEIVDFAGKELLFDSGNRPVVVFTKSEGTSQQSLWVARKLGEEWELTQVREAGASLYLYAALDSDDKLHIVFNTEDGVYYATVIEDTKTLEGLLLDYEENGNSFSYWAGSLTTGSESSLLGVFAEHQSRTDESTLIAGKATGGSWSFEGIANIGSYSSHGPVGGFDIAEFLGGLKVIFLYFYDASEIVMYVERDGTWQKLPHYVMEVSGEATMKADCDGNPVILGERELASFW